MFLSAYLQFLLELSSYDNSHLLLTYVMEGESFLLGGSHLHLVLNDWGVTTA